MIKYLTGMICHKEIWVTSPVMIMEKNVNMEVVGTDKCNSISGKMLKPIESLKNILDQIISQKLSKSSEGSSEC